MEKEKTWLDQVENEIREEMSLAGEILFSIPATYDCEKMDQFRQDEHPMYITEKTMDDQIDELEEMMSNYDAVDCPLKHRFVKGMYIREILMPIMPDKEMTLVTSLIHLTNHPYFILKGKVSVFSDNDGEQMLQAGDWGITRPATRRVLRIWEDCTWVTCHFVPWLTGDEDYYSDEEKEKIVDRIRSEIIEPHVNACLGGVLVNNILTKNIDQK